MDTFLFTKYGTINGEIIDLSNDAVTDEQEGLVYRMPVAMARDAVEVNDKPVELYTGITARVESKTGTRKMTEFFLSPLLRYAKESANEVCHIHNEKCNAQDWLYFIVCESTAYILGRTKNG